MRRRDLVKKVAGVGAACAFTIGMNVIVAGNTGDAATAKDFVGPVMESNTEAPTAAPTATPVTTVRPVAQRYRHLAISIADDYVNVRKSNSIDSEIKGKLYRGSAAKVLSVKGDWLKIRSGSVTGYVNKEFVATGARAERLSKKFGKSYAIVKKGTETLNVREEKSTECGIVTQISDGDGVLIKNESEDWVKVKTKDGDTGYVAKEYVSTRVRFKHAVSLKAERQASESKSSSDTASSTGTGGIAVARYALQFVGNPYVWGGSSLTSGTDCSGFTMRVLGKFGHGLPHSSAAQAGYGRSVSLSELQPGDLVFYKHGSSIGHVAIYIGGGRIVHAAGKKWGIVTASVNYRKPYCARRIVG